MISKQAMQHGTGSLMQHTVTLFDIRVRVLFLQDNCSFPSQWRSPGKETFNTTQIIFITERFVLSHDDYDRWNLDLVNHVY
jgi:hypothetical protein